MKTGLDVLQLVLGLALLYAGAAWLVRGSAGMARGFGVKPLVIGLTVVAYGTSAPELAVATKTALGNAPAIALGTVIGSCTANIALVLGATALIAAPKIDGRVIRREVPILIGSVIAVPVFLRNGVLSRVEGIVLIACAIVFTIVTLTISARLDPEDQIDWDPTSRRPARADAGGRARPRHSRLVALALTAVGLAVLIAGSELFVRGARKLGGDIGMSERMLGLTIVALGTSLPELVGSIAAARRGQAQLAIGNVIGSNLLNVFLVLGITAYLKPIDLGERMHVVDLVGLVVITLLGVVMLRGSRRISRLEGAILIASYVGFVAAAAIF